MVERLEFDSRQRMSFSLCRISRLSLANRSVSHTPMFGFLVCPFTFTNTEIKEVWWHTIAPNEVITIWCLESYRDNCTFNYTNRDVLRLTWTSKSSVNSWRFLNFWSKFFSVNGESCTVNCIITLPWKFVAKLWTQYWCHNARYSVQISLSMGRDDIYNNFTSIFRYKRGGIFSRDF